jgi:hypothetical protein
MNYRCYQTVIGLALIVYGRWRGRLINRVRVTELRALSLKQTTFTKRYMKSQWMGKGVVRWMTRSRG